MSSISDGRLYLLVVSLQTKTLFVLPWQANMLVRCYERTIDMFAQKNNTKWDFIKKVWYIIHYMYLLMVFLIRFKRVITQYVSIEDFSLDFTHQALILHDFKPSPLLLAPLISGPPVNDNWHIMDQKFKDGKKYSTLEI